MSGAASPASSAPSASSVMQRLKEETLASHRALEGEVSLMDAHLSRSDYQRHLEKMWAFWAALAGELGRWAGAFEAAGFALDLPTSLGLLEADLKFLGRVDIRAVPPLSPSGTPILDTEGKAWGALYVVEGSALGGQVLTRELGPRLGLTERAGLAFLSRGGASPGARWRAFGTALEARARTEDEAGRSGIVEGARATFDGLRAWLRAVTPA